MKVQMFIPCFVDQVCPDVAAATLKLLNKAGCEVVYNNLHTCCGQPAFNSGYWDKAKEVAQHCLDNFREGVPIVSPSSSCTGMVKHYYDDLFSNSVSHNKCRNIQSKIAELTAFLTRDVGIIDFGAEFNYKVVYHDSCSALRECQIKEEPRVLLAKVKGLELLELPDHESCCGFGGTFSVKFPEISSAMAEQKLNNALSVGAEYIVSADASCLMHLDSYIKRNSLPIKTIHIAEVLTAGWI